MKVIFFSESNIKGKVPRDFENARTEFGWSIMLDAEWCPLNDSPTEKYDLGIVIIPKNNPRVDLYKYRLFCNKVSVMQEGPHWYYQDYSVENQIHYLNTIREADWIYCHNKSDIKYYKGLGCKDVRVMRSMMIPEGLDSQYGSQYKDGILLGGNFVSWYGGMDSYLVASEVDDQKYGVSMGRKQEHSGLDTQELLHPQTTVEVGDLVSARTLIKKLYNDQVFYDECSEQTKELFNKHYSEDAWLKNWEKENK